MEQWSPGFRQAFPSKSTNQVTTIKDLEELSVIYGYLHQTDSEQDTHCTGEDVQAWIQPYDASRYFYLPYNPQAAGLIGRKNSLLKQQVWALLSKSILITGLKPLEKHE
jgi:hypothetical protein